MKITIYNPLFTEFNNTIYNTDGEVNNLIINYCASNFLDYELMNQFIMNNYDKCIYDKSNEYKKKIAEYSCIMFENLMKEKGFYCKIDFINIINSNHCISCNIRFNDSFIDDIKTFVFNHYELFIKYAELYCNITGTALFMNINNDISPDDLSSVLLFILLVENNTLNDFNVIKDKYDNELYNKVNKMNYFRFTNDFFNHYQLYFNKTNEINRLREQGGMYMKLMKTQNPQKDYHDIIKNNLKKLIDELVYEMEDELN